MFEPLAEVHPYDKREFDFVSIVEKHLGFSPLTALHQFYDLPPLSEANEQRLALNRRLYAIGEDFFSTYRLFITQWLISLVGEEVYSQTIPNFRFQIPGSLGVSKFHKDSDLGHSLDEINVWVPLTPTSDSSTIWIEDQPNSGKFGPIVVPVGHALVFNGAALRHGNVANQTEDSRISFDFRVIAKARYTDNESLSVNTRTPLRLGGYFEELPVPPDRKNACDE